MATNRKIVAWMNPKPAHPEDWFSTHERPGWTPLVKENDAFTTAMIEAIYAAWHGAGVDIAGGNWKRFVGMLKKEGEK